MGVKVLLGVGDGVPKVSVGLTVITVVGGLLHAERINIEIIMILINHMVYIILMVFRGALCSNYSG